MKQLINLLTVSIIFLSQFAYSAKVLELEADALEACREYFARNPYMKEHRGEATVESLLEHMFISGNRKAIINKLQALFADSRLRKNRDFIQKVLFFTAKYGTKGHLDYLINELGGDLNLFDDIEIAELVWINYLDGNAGSYRNRYLFSHLNSSRFDFMLIMRFIFEDLLNTPSSETYPFSLSISQGRATFKRFIRSLYDNRVREEPSKQFELHVTIDNRKKVFHLSFLDLLELFAREIKVVRIQDAILDMKLHFQKEFGMAHLLSPEDLQAITGKAREI